MLVERAEGLVEKGAVGEAAAWAEAQTHCLDCETAGPVVLGLVQTESCV